MTKFLNLKSIWQKIIDLSQKERFSGFVGFLKFIIVYGLLINIMLTTCLSFKFNMISWIGWGIAYYFIKIEILGRSS